MMPAGLHKAFSAPPPKRPYNDLVRSLFTRAAATADTEPFPPPRCPSRMEFYNEQNQPLSSSSSPSSTARVTVSTVTPAPSPATLKRSPELDDPVSDSSDDWAEDIVLVDSMQITYFPPNSSHTHGSSSDEDEDVFCERTVVPPTITAEELDFTYVPRPTPYFPARLCHHGHSRSALQHQKWLWSARYDEWMQWQYDVEEAAATQSVYGGLADASAIEPPPGLRSRSPSPLSSSAPTPSPSPAPAPKSEWNPSIFPRTGDLAALRDPESARVDRLFGNYPLCTLQKAMFALSLREREREQDSASVYSATSSLATVTDSTSQSATSSDDDVTSVQRKTTPPEWERTWDPRWEVLQELITLSEATPSTSPSPSPVDSSSTLATTSFGLPVVLRALDSAAEVEDEEDEETGYAARQHAHFFFGEDSDQSFVAGDDDDHDEEEDDEDDYGEVVLNPRFRGPFATEYEASPDFDTDRHGVHELHVPMGSGPSRGRISL